MTTDKSKTLYVSDLDGTLLDRKAELPSETVRILNALIDDGLNFTYATARSWTSASAVIKNLKLMLPAITYNGAFVVNPDSGRIIRSFTLENESSSFLLDAISRLNLYPLVYTLIGETERVMWVTGHETSGISGFLESRKGDKRLMGVGSRKELNQGQIFSLLVIGTESELVPLAGIIKNEKYFSSVLTRDIYTNDYWLEIYDAQASKASGLKWFRENYGFQKIVCFGDNLNDISMFQAADEGYAVQNACEELKHIASGIIGSNEENGVARFIENAIKFKLSHTV
jgi:Cof subfamily protein (haloacid dehalogenase superfamily)